MTYKGNMHRRSFIRGLLAAPVVITTPGLLMPVRSVPLGPPPILIGPPIFENMPEDLRIWTSNTLLVEPDGYVVLRTNYRGA